MQEIPLTDLIKLIETSLFAFFLFLGGVYVGYLLGFIDGNNNF